MSLAIEVRAYAPDEVSSTIDVLGRTKWLKFNGYGWDSDQFLSMPIVLEYENVYFRRSGYNSDFGYVIYKEVQSIAKEANLVKTTEIRPLARKA